MASVARHFHGDRDTEKREKPRPILRGLNAEERAALDQVAANTGTLRIPIDGHAFRALQKSLAPSPPPPKRVVDEDQAFEDALLEAFFAGLL